MSVGLFGLKGGAKKEERAPPIDRVKSMMQTGLSEREIIRQLKAEGYGFSAIEKAMMNAMKEGVSAAPVAARKPEYMPAPPAQAPQPAQYPAPEWPQPAYPTPSAPSPYEEEREAVPLELPALEAPAEQETPEDIIEDVLEGLTEEKFEKFSGETKKLREDFEKLRAEMRASKEKGAAPREAPVSKELIDKIDDLEARVGGLEKAFRQFLPSLTENIEQLSKIIHEMRSKKSE